MPNNFLDLATQTLSDYSAPPELIAETEYFREHILPVQQLENLRRERNRLLAETDWTQSRDVTLPNDAEWAAYRQALRDLPANTTDPANPIWPIKPE